MYIYIHTSNKINNKMTANTNYKKEQQTKHTNNI